jgi:hypothetical protein
MNTQLTGFFSHRYMDHVGTRHSLILHRVEPEDLAAYACSATNKIGSAAAKLELKGSPQAPRLATRVEYLGRGSYRVSWSTESYAPITQYTLLYRKIPVGFVPLIVGKM